MTKYKLDIVMVGGIAHSAVLDKMFDLSLVDYKEPVHIPTPDGGVIYNQRNILSISIKKIGLKDSLVVPSVDQRKIVEP